VTTLTPTGHAIAAGKETAPTRSSRIRLRIRRGCGTGRIRREVSPHTSCPFNMPDSMRVGKTPDRCHPRNRQARRASAAASKGPGAPRRARVEQAFDSANEIHARYRGLPDMGRRAAAVSRARTWGDILRHMDAMEYTEFCGYLGDDTPPAVVRAVWAARDWLTRVTWWLNVSAGVRAFPTCSGPNPSTSTSGPRRAERRAEGDPR
jgi:hypothetical protein